MSERQVVQASSYWRGLSQKRLSRRRVLEAGAVGFGGAALALAGCGGGEEKNGTPGADENSFLTPIGKQETPVYGGHGVSATRTIFSGLDLQVGVDNQAAAVYHGYLFSIDRRDETLEAQAAESHEMIDEVTHVWKLRQGIKFQNVDPTWGRELTAADVVYSTTGRRDNPAGQANSIDEGYDATTRSRHVKGGTSHEFCRRASSPQL